MNRTKKTMYPVKSRNISKHSSSQIKPNKEIPSRKMQMKSTMHITTTDKMKTNVLITEERKRMRRLTKFAEMKGK